MAIRLVQRLGRWWRPLLWASLLSAGLSVWALISLWLLPAGLAYLHTVPLSPAAVRASRCRRAAETGEGLLIIGNAQAHIHTDASPKELAILDPEQFTVRVGHLRASSVSGRDRKRGVLRPRESNG